MQMHTKAASWPSPLFFAELAMRIYSQSFEVIRENMRATIRGTIKNFGILGYDVLAFLGEQTKGSIPFESLTVGQSFERPFHVGKDAVFYTAHATGDRNPAHMSPRHAAKTQFGKPIAHGVLLEGIISRLLGMDFPGVGTIYCEKRTKFRRPVYIGDDGVARVTILSIDRERRRVVLQAECFVAGEQVMRGESEVYVP